MNVQPIGRETITRESYIAKIAKMTPDALQEELDYVQGSLKAYQGSEARNTTNGYGDDENTIHQRKVIRTLEEMVTMINTQQANQ